MDAPFPVDGTRLLALTNSGPHQSTEETVFSPPGEDDGGRAISRRMALQAAAGLSVGTLAGCPADPNTTPGDTNQDTFDSVAVEGLSLVVTLTASATVDKINVIAPTGQLFAEQSVETGVQKVSFDLGTSYAPGEFRVIAVHQEETVEETTVTIQPEWKITEFGLGANHPKEMPEDMSQDVADDEAFVTVTNQGSGPDAIKQLLILGFVPNPTTKIADSDLSGIYEKSNPVVVKPGENRRLFTTSIPFRFIREGNVTCQQSRQSGTFDVVLVTSVSDRVQRKYSIQYSAAESFDGCKITVEEKSQ